MQPYVDFAMEQFSAERLMFGGDWLVCILGGSCAIVWANTQPLLANRSPPERDAVVGRVIRRPPSIVCIKGDQPDISFSAFRVKERSDISDFEDTVALITGASRGIGAALAHGFAAQGARVIINHFEDHTNAARLAKEINASGMKASAFEADVADSQQVAALVQHALATFGQIDVLVCNAGICPFYDFLELPEAVWERTMDVNLKGVFLVAQQVARHMVERGAGGRIVATSSISSMVGGTQQAHYCASKAGINLLIKSMALSLAPHGITCNAVLPGTVETDLNRAALQDAALRAQLEQGTPLGRLGQPEDLVSAVLFLTSPGASWITGTLLVVDGGATSTLQ